MIFQALQSELFRFKFHFLGSKLQKIPELNLLRLNKSGRIQQSKWWEWTDESKAFGPSTFTQLERPYFLNTVHFHLNPKFTLYIRNGHMCKSPPRLLDDIIGKDQSDFSFEWNSLWKWWIEFILFIWIAQRNKKSFFAVIRIKIWSFQYIQSTVFENLTGAQRAGFIITRMSHSRDLF